MARQARRPKRTTNSLAAIRDFGGHRKPHDGRDDPKECDRERVDPCEALVGADDPEEIVYFRQPVLVEQLDVDLGGDVDDGGNPPLEFNCLPVDRLVAYFAFDLRFEQWWFYRRPLIGALSASVALAPGETLALSVRNTQRKQFDRETVNEVERTEQAESTIADKDVLNVTRSSSKTNNWSINGNASLSLSSFSVGASGSVSQSITEASSSSAQRSRESTQRSASNLKTLQKVQVRETTEVTTEATTARTIVNPYRDRSLRLDIYELLKEFCVEFHRREAVPVLILDVETLRFDRNFVLTSGAFLVDALVDRWLSVELTDALQVTTDLRYEGADEHAESIALTALEYLYSGPPVFNFPPFSPLLRPAGWDENDPANSFQEPLEAFSGLGDAVDNRVAVTFSILAFYYRLYVDRVLPNNGRLAVELAMSLDQLLAPRWTGVEETEQIANTIDASQATEVLRRLGGFLTMTSGVLAPLMKPAEDDRDARRAAERAEFVIARVIDHLECHRQYYTDRYLAFMAERTRMDVVYHLVEEVLVNRLDDTDGSLAEIFDAEASFLDGRRVVVPIRIPVDPDELAALLERFGEKPVEIKPRRLDVQKLAIPMDGVHIEPSVGSCVVQHVPDQVVAPLHVVVDKE